LRYIALKSELASIDQLLKNYLQERSALSTDLVTYETRVNATPGLESELGQRMRDAALTRARYEGLFARQQEAKLAQRAEKSAKSAKGVAFRVVEPAQLPSAPVGPQPRRLILMALVAGLGLGLAAVVFAERMDSSFATVEELQDFTTMPVLSALPSVAVAGKSGFDRRRLAVLTDPNSIAAEQFSVLSLKIVRSMQQTGGQVLVVTSAAGGEGKSFTSLNLSLALARSVEGKVLLIDSDLRRPQVHQYLGLESGTGLGDLLSSKAANARDYIVQAGPLSVILGGAQPANTVGLLASPHFRDTLARLKQEYKIIVLDSPPIVPIADSHILAGIADGVLMVVRARQTTRALFRRAVESLDATNVLGIALNDVHYADTSYAYACRYYHRHYLRRR
jgi:succinoglycan biosynthesis transport protein ExoP